VHAGEADRCEPARGAWAHVAQGVPAVDDHIASGIELLHGFGGELLQRNVDRAGEVQFLVLLAREHLEELRPIGEQLPQAIEIDGGHAHAGVRVSGSSDAFGGLCDSLREKRNSVAYEHPVPSERRTISSSDGTI
jgi:hypothetical protein